MTVELWYQLVHYFLGVVSVLALLFALVETSRQYDRHKEKSYLLLAIGFFCFDWESNFSRSQFRHSFDFLLNDQRPDFRLNVFDDWLLDRSPAR